jgi:hypothetical protein
MQFRWPEIQPLQRSDRASVRDGWIERVGRALAFLGYVTVASVGLFIVAIARW